MGTPDRQRLVDAMQVIERLLDPESRPRSSTVTAVTAVTVVLRDVRPGDLGWVVQAHGEAYTREYGWDTTFEALVAEIVAGFVRTFDSSGERGWIAEIDGERVGSIFLVRGSVPTTAKIRLLLVTPAARGSGLGNRLITECVEFARSKGYEKIELWTHSCLTAARTMYAKRGFALVESDEYEGFGKKLVWENWEMTL
jgi:GNAT superfamily N-acetyltransferase